MNPIVRGVAAALVSTSTAALAQIATDGTMGAAGALSGPNFAIGSNLGTLRGGNLFHSFSQFNVLTGQSATFSGPGSVTNIVGRVTGGSASSIDGVLRSTITGANLWLMNPKGVMFGPNASLDLSGSFHVTTADYLKLGSSGQFNATNPGASTLSSAPPSAFGFLGPAVAGIAVNGATLRGALGKGLSFIGGDITLNNATLRTSSGPINLASLAAGGEVTLSPAGVAGSGVASWGGIAMQNATIDASNTLINSGGGISIVGGRLAMTGSRIKADSDGFPPGADIGVRVSDNLRIDGGGISADSLLFGKGGNITVSAGSIDMLNAGEISASSHSGGAAGSVTVGAGDLNLSGGATITSSSLLFGDAGSVSVSAGRLRIEGYNPAGGAASGIFASSESTFNGNAGSLAVNAGSIELLDGGSISGSTFGPGRGGPVEVTVTGRLRIAGMSPFNVGAGIYANSTSTGADSGDAGTLHVRAGSIVMEQGGFIEAATRGHGNAGAMVIEADSIAIAGGAINAYTAGAGKAGGISLTARDMNFSAGGYVNSSTSSSGNGGDVVVQGGTLRIEGSSAGGTVSGIYANASTGSTGNAGTVSVLADSIELLNGGAIVSSSFGAGRGGDLVIGARGRLHIAGSGPNTVSGIYASSTAAATGDAGTAQIAADSIVLEDRGAITVGTSGAGNAGDLLIAAREIRISGGAIAASDTFGSGRGGNVGVTATQSLEIAGENPLSHADSGIFARSQRATSGAAGAITVEAGMLRIGTGGAISAQTEGAGNAGSVTVRAADIGISGGGYIGSTTFGGAGRGGDVAVTADGALRIEGAGADGSVSGIYALSSRDASGDAGSLTVRAGSIDLLNGGEISAATFTSGRAGALDVSASGRLLIAGRGPAPGNYLSGIFGSAEDDATGDAGSVSVRAGSIVVGGGGTIRGSTTGPGNAGTLTVAARDIDLVDGGEIASSTSGAGRGGNVNVAASGRLRASGSSADGFSSGLFSTADAAGDAGSLMVNAGSVELLDSGIFTATTFGAGNAGNVSVVAAGAVTVGGVGGNGFGSGIVSAATFGATGNAGQVSVQAGSISVGEGGSIGTNTRGPGNAGSIALSAATIALPGGTVQSLSTGTGRAGSIVILASDSLQLLAGGSINTEALSSDGGDISIQAGELVYLNASQITTSVGTGAGNGGNISIDPTFVVLIDSQIIANAFGGNGGNISIVADNFLTMNSLVQASSALGLPGSVQIAAPKVDVSSGLATLNANYLDASSLMRESCAARAGRSQANSFTGTGRGGLAQGPGALGAQVEDKVSLAPQIRSGRLQLARAGCD